MFGKLPIYSIERSTMPPGRVHMRDQMGPGSTVFTRTTGAYCFASALVRYSSAALHDP